MKLDYADARILIVDDDLKSLAVLTKLMQIEDFRISFATEPRRAIEIARVTMPELVICDIMFPDHNVDGIWLLDQFMSDPVLQHIPVIIYSALEAPGYAPQSYTHGAASFVRKPMDADGMAARVASHVNRYRKHRAALSIAMDSTHAM